MAYEIERKFLLLNEDWRSEVTQTLAIQQAYLCNTDKASLRIRVSDQTGYISTKSMTRNIRRHEFEYEIPLHDAEFMIQHMAQGSPVIKKRHLVPKGSHVWEIDEFEGSNAGLIVAEIELGHETEAFDKPLWVGDEVSGDTRYLNISLVGHPYCDWTT